MTDGLFLPLVRKFCLVLLKVFTQEAIEICFSHRIALMHHVLSKLSVFAEIVEGRHLESI